MKILKIFLIACSIIIPSLVSGCIGSGTTIETEIFKRLDKIPPGNEKITPEEDMSPSILVNSDWEKPVPLSAAINSAGLEDSPFILPEGNELYFFFTPDAKAAPQKQVMDGVSGIYYSKNNNGEWTEPLRVLLQDKNKISLDGCQFISGDVMWFGSAREGNFRDIDIYTAELKNGIWTNWKNAGKLLNVEYEIGEFHITADGKEMYFHSDKNGSKGGLDIWVTSNKNGNWQTPQNLEEINSEEDEGWPFITNDKKELWFTRTYKGTPAIYRSKKLNDKKWSTPELILYQFAGEPSLDLYGNIYFVHHYFSNSIMLESDIYVSFLKDS